MSFASQIKAFEEKALLAANRSVSNAVEEIFTSAVVNTPSPTSSPTSAQYSTGLLANQWYPEVSSFSGQLSSATNPYGADSLSRIKALSGQQLFLKRDNVITLTNNVDHAQRAEYLGWPQGKGTNGWTWTGTVGPYAMVGRAVAAWRGKYL